jgi:hypothetical protein
MNLHEFYAITPGVDWSTLARCTRFAGLMAPWRGNASQLKTILQEVYMEARGVRAIAEALLKRLEVVAFYVRWEVLSWNQRMNPWHHYEDDAYEDHYYDVFDHDRRHEYYAQRRDRLDDLFAKWRDSVRSRGVVIFWMRVTAERTCAPGGSNQVEDQALFEEEFS